MKVVTEMRIPLGMMGLAITKSFVAVRIWHSRPPHHGIHTVVPRAPRSYNETSSSSSWTRIQRYRLRIPLDRGKMDQLYPRALQLS